MEDKLLIDTCIKNEFSKDLFTLVMEDLQTSVDQTDIWYKTIAESSRIFHQGFDSLKRVRNIILKDLLYVKKRILLYKMQSFIEKENYKKDTLHYCIEQFYLSDNYFQQLLMLYYQVFKLYTDDSIMKHSEIRAWNHFVRGLIVADCTCREYLQQNLELCKHSIFCQKRSDWLVFYPYPYQENVDVLQNCYQFILK